MIGLLPGQVELLLLEPEHLQVLSSAVSSEVFAALDSRRALSVREVARDLGKSTSAVGEQVAKLVAAGLVVPAGTRKRRSRTEALYVHKGVITRFLLKDQPPETIEAYIARFNALMRQAARQHATAQWAIHRDPSLFDYFAFKQHSAFLTPEGALRVRAAIDELMELIGALSQPAASEEQVVRVSFNAMLFPSSSVAQRPNEDL
jgi:predicted transcriptional regulator